MSTRPNRVGGSARRRLEVVLGGPARPFDLTVRDADSLADCVSAFIQEFQEASLADGGEPEDPGVVERLSALRERLYEHAGYGRKT